MMKDGHVVGLIIGMVLVAASVGAQSDPSAGDTTAPANCLLCICNNATPNPVLIGCERPGLGGFTLTQCMSACAPGTGGIFGTSRVCSVELGCPASELGRCNDGLNNDAYLNLGTDALDLECARHVAPALSSVGLAAVGLLLLGGGASVVRRRQGRS